MRSRVVSLLAGAAVLALCAGGVLATVDAEDQHQDAHDAPSAWDAADYPTAQTFTAGVSGHIDSVWLWGMTTGWNINVEIHDGGPTGALLGTSSSASPVTADDWFPAAFNPAVPVTALSTYAIVITGSNGSVRIGGTCTSDAYAGGQALVHQANTWQPIATDSYFENCLTDFAFRTYEIPTPTQTTKLQWDKTQVDAGKTTPLTLTETFTFVEIVGAGAAAPAASPPMFTVKQVALPAWFHVTAVGCSVAQIAPADCILPNVAPGSSLPVTPNGAPIIVTLTGTATPDPSAGGTTGTATGESCTAGVTGNPDVCVTDQATVAVAAPAPTASPNSTPPPTSTAPQGPIGDSALPLALLACLGFGGLGIAAFEVRRRSIPS